MNKKKCFLAVVLAALIGIQVQAQLKVGSTGNIGMGTDPTTTEKLRINGNSYLTGNLGIGATPSTTEKLRISGNSCFLGNIGIGTAPTTLEKLKVMGRAYFTSFTTQGGIGIGESSVPISQSISLSIPSIFCDEPNYPGTIGTSARPFYEIRGMKLYYTSIFQVPSDMRMKTNIKKAPDAKKKLDMVNIYQYDVSDKFFKHQDEKTAAISASLYTNQTGVMAQELKEIFPELVCYDSINDMYGVNYVGFIPHLIQAVQNQSKEIETLKTELAYYQTNCCSVSKDTKKSISVSEGTTRQAQLSDAVTSARLDQNAPNPFSKEARIGYFVPTGAKAAYLFIYDLQGKQLKQILLNTPGEGSTTIQGREFTAGMYLYSLVIDNELVDTKRMILTE